MDNDASARRQRICALNDQLRKSRLGGHIVITAGVVAENDDDAVARVLSAIASFDHFNGDNDPYGEHDCASLTVDDNRIMFKIDYYDRAMACHSPDPADEAVTCRVMTVMLAAEY